MRFFVDANILLYARDRSAGEAKRLTATAWLSELARREMLLTNLQVLNEVCHVSLRKMRHLTAEDVRRWVDELACFGSAPLDSEIVDAAWAIQKAYRFSWFDCLILGSADHLGCTHVLTEDMGSPRRVGALQLINPFAADPDAFLPAS